MTVSTMLLVALVSSTGVTEATAADSRWLPFTGCWTLVEDEVRQPLLLEPGSEEAQPRPQGLVCLAPGVEGAQVETYSGDEMFLEEALVADGARHDIQQGNCSGWQKLDWSGDGSALFTRAELTCEEGRKRSVSGISTIEGMSTWVEIQSVGTGDGSTVLIRRYRPASDEVSLLRLPSLTELDLEQASRARREQYSPRTNVDEVVEASAHVEPEVVEALILERGGPFDLDSKNLVRLSDASVSPRIIDLMIAMTFPDRFEVERQSADGRGGGFGYSGGYDPFWSSAYAYPYYFAPFGYYYWYAPWDPVYGIRPPVLPEGSVGRVIQGRGYTRVNEISPFQGGGGRQAKRRGESGTSGDWSKGSSSDGSSSSGTASPQGYSRGGTSGRTAKPKKK